MIQLKSKQKSMSTCYSLLSSYEWGSKEFRQLQAYKEKRPPKHSLPLGHH